MANCGAEIRRILDQAQRTWAGSGLDATVTGGVVELKGTFNSKNQLEATLRGVACVDGVVGIRNRMVSVRDESEFLVLSVDPRDR